MQNESYHPDRKAIVADGPLWIVLAADLVLGVWAQTGCTKGNPSYSRLARHPYFKAISFSV
jgi:hypothetical protein